MTFKLYRLSIKLRKINGNLCTCVVVSRSVSNRIAFGIRSDRVRRLIRLRSVSDRIAFGVR